MKIVIELDGSQRPDVDPAVRDFLRTYLGLDDTAPLELKVPEIVAQQIAAIAPAVVAQTHSDECERGDVPVGTVMQEPVAPSAPSAPTADKPADSFRPEVDKEGYPWDERIHSGSKKITLTGIWARRKNISDELYDSVRAELRAAQTPAPTVAEASVPPAPPAPPAAPAPASVLMALSQAVARHQITLDDLMAELGKYGLSNLGQLAANPLAEEGMRQFLAEKGLV